jgi:hypothetical protein
MEYIEPTLSELHKRLEYEMELVLVYEHSNKKSVSQCNAQRKKAMTLADKITAMCEKK